MDDFSERASQYEDSRGAIKTQVFALTTTGYGEVGATNLCGQDHFWALLRLDEPL